MTYVTGSVSACGAGFGIYWAIRSARQQLRVIPRLWNEWQKSDGRARLEVQVVNRSDKVTAQVQSVAIECEGDHEAIPVRATSAGKPLPVSIGPKEVAAFRFMVTAEEVMDTRWAYAWRVTVRTADGRRFSRGGRAIRYSRQHYPKTRGMRRRMIFHAKDGSLAKDTTAMHGMVIIIVALSGLLVSHEMGMQLSARSQAIEWWIRFALVTGGVLYLVFKTMQFLRRR